MKAQRKIIKGTEQSLKVPALQHWAPLSVLSENWLLSSVREMEVKWKLQSWMLSENNLPFLLLPKFHILTAVLHLREQIYNTVFDINILENKIQDNRRNNFI